MIDTIPMPLDPLGRAAPASRPFSAAQPAHHTLPVEFSGSGSEYFRIWIVNLLLILVTLGLYYPWAKVRRLRYFYGNTSVGGHAFDFHGNPKRMLRGFLLVGALVLLYSAAGQVSAGAGLVAFLIVAAVWPALFRASQQFRMANTSWRGLRLRFDGDQAGAYRAMLPLFVPSALVLAGVMLGEGGTPRTGGALAALAGLAALLLFPLFFWMLKKYQHDHYALGQVQTQLRSGPGSFYALALKTAGVAVLAALAAATLAAAIGGFGALTLAFGRGGRPTPAAFAAIAVLFVAVYAAVILVVYPYLTSRVQNLVWSRTHSRLIQFDSALRFWPLLRLTLKNWLLVLVTLGLYLPFAKVATARLRLEAVSVQMLLPPDELVDTLRARADDASGDAAGDLAGIDFGL